MIDTDRPRGALGPTARDPAATSPTLTTHGDLMPGNLLVTDGRLPP